MTDFTYENPPNQQGEDGIAMGEYINRQMLKVSNSVEQLSEGVDNAGDVVGPDSAIDGNNAVFDGTTGKKIKDGGPAGDVTGPSSATDGNLAVFDGATGKLIKDGGPPGGGSSGAGSKNYARNPQMEIHQRGTSKQATSNEEYIDGYEYFSNYATQTVTQSISVAPTTPGDEDTTKSYRLAFGANSPTIPGTSYFGVAHHLELRDIKDWLWGTSNAKTITVSFRMQDSLVLGPGGVNWAFVVQNGTNSYSYVSVFNVSEADWTDITITIPGNTATNFFVGLQDYDIGVSFLWMVQAGNYAPSANTWHNANYLGVSGLLEFASWSGAYIEISKIKIEVGSTRTDFTSDGAEESWAKARRYYQTSRTRNEDISTLSAVGERYAYASNAGDVRDNVRFVPMMRVAPTVSVRNPITGTSNAIRYNGADVAVTIGNVNESSFSLQHVGPTSNATVEYQFDANATMKTNL